MSGRWRVGPWVVTTEPGDEAGTYEWKVWLDGEAVVDDGLVDGDEDDALRHAMAEISGELTVDTDLLDDGVDPFRAPDFETSRGGVWWGPSDSPEDAEAFTEVDGDCVREYTFVGAHEGFADDAWRVIETCLDPAPKSVRLCAAAGVAQIGEIGGSEDLLDHDEVMDRFGNMRAPARAQANPREQLLAWSLPER